MNPCRLLFDQLKAVCDKGRKANFNWLWSKVRSIQRDLIGCDNVIVWKHVITTFLRKCNERMRARQRNCSKPKEVFRTDLRKWHSTVRERLVRMGAGFLPSQRFNVDQSPCLLSLIPKKTYEIIKMGDKHKKTWISQPSSSRGNVHCKFACDLMISNQELP